MLDHYLNPSAFSPQQLEAIRLISKWYNDGGHEQVFTLHGYAGTGKTTLANYMAQELAPGRAYFMAFTGKAVNVLKKKGCAPCTTIHRAIYAFAGNEDNGLSELTHQLLEEHDEEKREHLRQALKERRSQLSSMGFSFRPSEEALDAKLFIVDECSMLSQKLLDDLLKCGKKVILLGDPAQLPPVKAKPINLHCDFMMTEIHRQAASSPILQASKDIRSGKSLKLGTFFNEGSELVVTNKKIPRHTYEAADQIITARNATRIKINTQMREWLGRENWIDEEEKLVVTKNDHSLGINNGMIVTARNLVPNSASNHSIFSDLITEDDQRIAAAELWRGGFLGTTDVRGPEDIVMADYGYALTCHKAQGSEWEDVIIIDEGSFHGVDNRAWLYTALTRAKTRATIYTKQIG